MDSAKQYPRRPQIAGLHAQVDDLTYRSIAQKVVGHLDCDFHRGLGGALVPFEFVFVFLFSGRPALPAIFSALSAAERQIPRIFCAASISPIGHRISSSQTSSRFGLSNHHITVP
jgi:hypothetical protein